MSEDKPKKYYRGGLFGPLILIAIGIILLLNNVGGIKGNTWENILRLWPLLFIAGGLDSLLKREGIAGPVFGIGLGTVFLLSNFNLMTINAWGMLLRIWPLFLIAIGLDIALGRRSFWGALVAAAVMIALLLGALWYFTSDVVSGTVIADQITQTLGDASRSKVEIKPIAGSVSVSALEDSNNLVEGSVIGFKGEKILQSYKVEGGAGSYRLYTTGTTVIYFNSSQTEATWDLGLSPKIPLDLKTDMVAGRMRLDLSGLQLSQLETDLVAGETIVILPEQGRFSATLDGVVGKLDIIVPDGMEVKIDSDLGLVTFNSPPGFTRRGDQLLSPGYTNADNRVDIKVTQLIGLVSITRK